MPIVKTHLEHKLSRPLFFSSDILDYYERATLEKEQQIISCCKTVGLIARLTGSSFISSDFSSDHAAL
jgi:hypothetical protein